MMDFLRIFFSTDSEEDCANLIPNSKDVNAETTKRKSNINQVSYSIDIRIITKAINKASKKAQYSCDIDTDYLSSPSSEIDNLLEYFKNKGFATHILQKGHYKNWVRIDWSKGGE